MNNSLVIGITGGSGSGKTLFLSSLLQHFEKEEICLISQDNYYQPRDQQPIDDEGVKNFDLPESLNLKVFAKDIDRLRKGELVEIVEYTYNNPNANVKSIFFNPAPIIIVEGLFIYYLSDIARQLDLRIFIETDSHLMLKRRIIRDKRERGYDLDDVLYRFDKHVMPSFEKFILPYRMEADIIIPNNHRFETAVKVLTGYLRNHIDNHKGD